MAPVNLLTSSQSQLLKNWLTGYAQVVALITLPDSIFGHPSNAKSIIVLQKQTDHPMETFVYPIRDLKLAENIHDFMQNFKKWKQDNVN